MFSVFSSENDVSLTTNNTVNSQGPLKPTSNALSRANSALLPKRRALVDITQSQNQNTGFETIKRQMTSHDASSTLKLATTRPKLHSKQTNQPYTNVEDREGFIFHDVETVSKTELSRSPHASYLPEYQSMSTLFFFFLFL